MQWIGYHHLLQLRCYSDFLQSLMLVNMQGVLPTPHEQGKLDMHGPSWLACMPPNLPRAFVQASRLLTLSL